MWTRMSVGTLAEAEMDPDKYDKADANVSEADRRKIKNIDQPKGINRKWLVPIFFAFFQNHLTLYPLPRVISGKMIFLRKYRPHDLRNRQLVKK